MLVYTHKITYRIRYIFQLFFGQLLDIPYEITSDKESFLGFEGPRMSYGNAPVADELFISSHGLLFQRGIEGQELSFVDFKGCTAFFPSVHKSSAFPFDPFSAAFYLVSRYEEYLPYKLDEYGRFRGEDSISYQKDFLFTPVINIWASEMGYAIQAKYPTLRVGERKYRFIPTIDIDSAWQFKEKGILRTIGGYSRSLFKAEFKDIQRRTRVLLRVEEDPFETYGQQLKILSEYHLRPTYFILFGKYGLNDRNIQVNNPSFQVLVKSLADYADIGIHASFSSSYDPVFLGKEISALSSVIHRDVYRSRQHFLRLNLPYMYRHLADLNITEDYSMGYGSCQGFRAGIADPYFFYDLDLDMPTRVKVFPFAFFINKFWRLDSSEKLLLIKRIINEVKKVRGTLVGAWDNDALSQHRIWDWEGDLRKILELAVD
jgi:hypothetical protein